MEQDPMQVALSTDIVMEIVLSHLNARDLLSCRLASKFLNKAASSILRKRSTMMKSIADETGLMKLKTCMKKSLDFPFAGLKFTKPWRLNSGRAMEFFKNYGARFTRLFLNTQWVVRLHNLAPFIHYLSRLSILEVGPSSSSPPPAEFLDPDTRQEDGKILNIPSVRTIRISSAHSQLNEEVLCEVLFAASPSLQIECLDSTPKILRVLEKVGKLRAVSFMKLKEDEDNSEYDLEMNLLLSTESPSLTKLDFNAYGFLSREGLHKILFSSQHTLKELRMDRIPDMILWEGFPVLSKLTTLNLCLERCCHRRPLFSGRHGHKFPALKDLRLRVTYHGNVNVGTGVSDSLFIVPSVKKIDLEGYVNEDEMKKLARSFPNATEMRLEYGYYSGDFMPCGRDPFEIWNVREFKHLEKLRIWNYTVRCPSRKYIGMDSFLTGIPAGICRNLLEQERLDLINSPFNQVLRENSSILQLQDLKELVVCVKPGIELKKLPEDVPLISIVSVWYALEMMPNLQAQFVYEHPSPPSPIANRSKAVFSVLETAFKQVHPFIRLERSFY